MRLLRIGCAWGLGLLLCLPAAKSRAGEHLLGDWAGGRRVLAQRGVDAAAVLTLDAMQNLQGGLRRGGTLLGNLDLTFSADTARAGWWRNGTFFLYLLGDFNFGGPLTDKVGDIQGTDNIQAEPAFKLYELWYEQRLLAGRLSVLAGLHDYNSEFDVLDYAGDFINSSFGISPDISQVGPSIFPTTALALRIKARPTAGSYLMAAVYNGEPGDPGLPGRGRLHWSVRNGVFTAFEGGLRRGTPGQSAYLKLGLGAWVDTARTEDFAGQSHAFNHGLYLIGEKTIFIAGKNGEGLGAFFQLGVADPQRNRIGRYWGAGLHYQGLIPGRSGDVTGLAVARARNGSHFLAFAQGAGEGRFASTETVVEATYVAQLRPWLSVQPDVQYVVHPGGAPTLDDALVAGLRLQASL